MKIRKAVKTIQEKFKNVKFPYMKISGTFGLNPPKVPHLGIYWFNPKEPIKLEPLSQIRSNENKLDQERDQERETIRKVLTITTKPLFAQIKKKKLWMKYYQEKLKMSNNERRRQGLPMVRRPKPYQYK